jgi:hypothetical protein
LGTGVNAFGRLPVRSRFLSVDSFNERTLGHEIMSQRTGGQMMAAAPKKIKLVPDGDLAKLLEEAAQRPVLLDTGAALYRLDRLEELKDSPAGYDPRTALDGINAAAGSWYDLDPEEVKAFIYRGREEGTRPADQP